MSRLLVYYRLAKPGMVYGNVLAALTGFAVASGSTIAMTHLISLLIGLSLVMGSSCMVNNIRDRAADQRMRRTSRRPTATGQILPRHAWVVAYIVLALGVLIMAWHSRGLAIGLALVGWILYAGIYTSLKPRTAYATLVGSLPGALPPVIGYVSVTGACDGTTVLLLAALICWQMVHFYTIALRYIDEYRNADIPVYAVTYGMPATVTAIKVYSLVYVQSIVVLGIWLGLPPLAHAAIGLAHLALLASIWSPYTSSSSQRWARRVFSRSIMALSVWCAVTTAAAVLG